jgi:hypothetical protein
MYPVLDQHAFDNGAELHQGIERLWMIWNQPMRAITFDSPHHWPKRVLGQFFPFLALYCLSKSAP